MYVKFFIELANINLLITDKMIMESKVAFNTSTNNEKFYA